MKNITDREVLKNFLEIMNSKTKFSLFDSRKHSSVELEVSQKHKYLRFRKLTFQLCPG